MADYKEGAIIEVSIGEHIYITPPVPKKKEILFHDKKKSQQYWCRVNDFPKIFFDWHDEATPVGYGVELDAKETRWHDNGQLTHLSKEDTSLLFDKKSENGTEGLQEREVRRRRDGVWFYNNGEPTYLTGNHYAILQWLAMLDCDNSVEPGSNYGQYYQFQRDAAYFFEICKTIEYARGGVYVKPKKTGMTRFFSLVCLNEGMTTREKNIRMMSITETLCRESNFSSISHALQKVPNILMPSRSKQNEGEVKFGPPNGSRNPLKKGRKIEEAFLNTWVCTVPTARASFDSFTNYIAMVDEFPKISNSTYPEELLVATRPTVVEGFKRKGTIFWLSYVPEKSDRSFYESRDIYKGSKLKTRKRDSKTGEMYGDTESKLICHTLTVQEGMFNCCDQYGMPIPGKIWEKIKEEIDDCNGDAQKIEAVKRQYPTNENDPWSETGRGDTPFDNLRLGMKQQDLEEMHSIGDFPFKDFNLDFTKPPVEDRKNKRWIFDTNIKIKFVTDDEKREGKEHGRFKWFHLEWTPEWFLKKHLNKCVFDNKTQMWKPNPESPFFISIDPTNYRISKNTGRGSLNAIQVFILPNAAVNAEIGKDVTNRRLMVSYLFRRDRPTDTMDDIIMVILLFGCMVQIESNVSTWVSKLIEMGLGHFVMMVNKEGALEPWKPFDDTQNYFTSQVPQIDSYFDAGADFLGAPMREGELDNIEPLDDIDVISQLQRIRKENTKEFDAAVAYLEGQMGIEAYLGWKRSEEKRKRPQDGVARAIALGIMR